MTTSKPIDRRVLLTSTITAWAAVTLAGCSGDASGGGTQGSGGSGTGGTGMGGATSGGATSGGATSGGATSGGATSGGATSGGTAGMSGGGMSNTAGMSGGGMSGGGNGGVGGEMSMGPSAMCTADTNNGNHSHPLTIPGEDVINGYAEAPYVLEDGGTGHTHTLEVSAYDFVYLQAGAMRTIESSMDAGHTHPCKITCVIMT